MDTQIQQLIDKEFVEVPLDNYSTYQLGKKYTKHRGFKLAQYKWDEAFDQKYPLFELSGNQEYFAQVLGNLPAMNTHIIQRKDFIEFSKEDALGTQILVKKRITKKPQNQMKNKLIINKQTELNMLELNPKTYLLGHQDSLEVNDNKTPNVLKDLYDQVHLVKQETNSRVLRKRIHQSNK